MHIYIYIYIHIPNHNHNHNNNNNNDNDKTNTHDDTTDNNDAHGLLLRLRLLADLQLGGLALLRGLQGLYHIII